ncbi:lysozyme inhibitor LprI family protein [Luteolibacter luteus]|uniref:DUF1311 domain-containing protein n=1 Tax=Luteolibacter luteus TaxID=2728835 RepID=A0A858RH47_9BACT|nr:lysozyme inhibitor LprI family protein [Luteolibacter luteus]QJE96197.1 DUF1311 domain-containing protein [Luteolibacter luteus]
MKCLPLLSAGFIAMALVPVCRAQSQQEMNAQAAEAFKKADKELNEVYAKVIGVLDDEAKERLKKSQRAWVAFRDAEAEFRADAEARGGSMWPLVHEGVRGKLTKDRVAALREYLIEEREK